MYNYQLQRDALRVAMHLLSLLPVESCFSMMVTDADTNVESSVFNLFVKKGTVLKDIGSLYATGIGGHLIEQGEGFVSYKLGALVVSIIEKEE